MHIFLTKSAIKHFAKAAGNIQRALLDMAGGSDTAEISDKQARANQSNIRKAREARWAKPETDTKKPIKGPERISAIQMDELYHPYPRKDGKAAGYRVLKRIEASKFELVRQAITNYKAHCELNNTEKQYIKQFGTFMNNWQDWADKQPEDLSTAVGKSSWERKKEQLLKQIEEDKKNGSDVS